VSVCDEEKVNLGYGVLNAELGLATQPLRPQDRVPRLASELDAPEDIQYRALELAQVAEETGIANGRNPSGVAAACLYLAGLEHGREYTQQRLADLADVSAITLRERYRELRAQR
jgi:transcription initiation factor TFIIB